ncbi:hypothetical protein T4D_9765 [Trichinella pseudospiralis]|uniref:Uncharacterized protein n=1 Tax=Trichinella pseudospiralis TaxID=6337 RepID=A0A0V1DR92_TRIPS|nr:hypothetical protein T4D_9765 [Trichinella pseudospiralis]
MENEKHPLDDMKNDEITENVKNEKCTLTWNMARKLKIMEKEKHPLDHLKNDEITEKREK